MDVSGALNASTTFDAAATGLTVCKVYNGQCDEQVALQQSIPRHKQCVEQHHAQACCKVTPPAHLGVRF